MNRTEVLCSKCGDTWDMSLMTGQDLQEKVLHKFRALKFRRSRKGVVCKSRAAENLQAVFYFQ